MVSASAILYWYMRLFFLFLLCLTPSAHAAQLASHQAIYNVSMIKNNSSNPIADIDGQITYSIQETCRHWIARNHADLAFSYRNGQNELFEDSYFATENTQTGVLEFATTKIKNNHFITKQRGKAVYDAKGQTLDIVTSDNNHDTRETYQGQFVFPVSHTHELMHQIENNVPYAVYNLYDGAEDTAYHFISTHVGSAKTHEHKKVWPVTFAYFDPNDKGAAPLYEMHFLMRKNGIIDTMDIVYDNFTVRQNLIDLKLLEIQACD